MLIFIAFSSSKSSDQSVHLSSLPSAFAIHIQNVCAFRRCWHATNVGVYYMSASNKSAQSRYIKTFRRRRYEIEVVVASAKAQTCAHLRTLGRALATQYI